MKRVETKADIRKGWEKTRNGYQEFSASKRNEITLGITLS